MSRVDELLAELAPNGVEYRALGEIAEVGTGNSDRKDASSYGQYPFYVRSREVRRKETFEFDEQAIVIPGEGNVGDIFHYVDGKYALHQRAYRIAVRDSRLTPKFVYYFLENHFKRFIESRAVTATVSSLRKPMIEAFLVAIPPLEVQHEIVRILDTFAELEAELHAELEVRQVQRSVYRDHLLSFPESASLSWVPLSELAGTGFFRDGDWVESKDQDSSGPVRLTQLADIGLGVFRDRSNRWMREDQAARLGVTFLEAGDLLIARMPDPIGRACEVPSGIGRAVTVVDVAILRSRHQGVVPRFVMHAVNSSAVHRRILSFRAGGTRQRISRTNLGSVKIPIPPLDEQRRIAGILDSFDALVNDLSVGLPAELKARRQQYEYYRDKLLTFPEAA